MRTLFLLDPLDSLNLTTETSLLLIEELARRGSSCAVAEIGDLFLSTDVVGVKARSIAVDMARHPFYNLGTPFDACLAPRAGAANAAQFDLVMMRKDPPVDASYLFATQVLEAAMAGTVVVNDPVSLRSFNEKLLALQFPELSPPTLVTHNAARLQRFADVHGRVVLKPLNDCSGRGIRIVNAHAAGPIIQSMLQGSGEPLLAQRFVDGVARGDKRIFLIAGEPVGAVNRIPQSPEHLANIHQGARVAATEITARERDIAATLRPLLVERGLWLAGLDVIDGFLTEVNVTSPSAVRQINAVSGCKLEVQIVDFLQHLVADRRGSVCLD